MALSLRSLTLSLALLSPLALAACGPTFDPTFDLAGLRDRHLFVTVNPDGEGFDVSVSLGHSSEECPSLGQDAVAEVDEVELPMLRAGGHYRGFDFNESCGHPTWISPMDTSIPGSARSVVRVKDASLTAELEVENLLVARSFSLSGSGELEPGQEVELVWSVPTDTLSFMDDGSSIFVTFVPDEGETGLNGLVLPTMELSREQVTLDGTRVRFTVPSGTPAGEGVLGVYHLSVQPHVVQSSGIEKVQFYLLPDTWMRTRVAAP